MPVPESSETNGQMREMVEADLPLVLHWRNQADVRRFMYTHHEISEAEHSEWFEAATADSRRHLLIFEMNKQALGFVNFREHEILPVANWGFYLSSGSPPGLGRDLGVAALRHAFSTLKLHKVCGEALDFNGASIKLHLKLGFKQEGLLREHYIQNDRYHDVIRFGILEHEWLQANL